MSDNSQTMNDEDMLEAFAMSERERALRDMFIAEYLVDYNKTNAAMRCGFPRNFAVQWGQKLWDEAYVQRKLKAMEMTPVDAVKEAEYNTQRIKQQLFKEAYYHGPGSSHAARVAALGRLQALYGMEAPKKSEVDIRHKGGVMRTPGIASLEEWEAAAVGSQEALQNGH